MRRLLNIPFTLGFCIYSASNAAYDAAGDLLSRVPGRLCFEIIRAVVYNNGFADDLIRPEPARQHLTIRPPVIAEQRREIARVTRMLRGFRVIMGACVRESGAAAIAALVDMKREKAGIRMGQAHNIRGHQRPSASGIEPDRPPEPRIRPSAFDVGDGRRSFILQINHLLTMLRRSGFGGEAAFGCLTFQFSQLLKGQTKSDAVPGRICRARGTNGSCPMNTVPPKRSKAGNLISRRACRSGKPHRVLHGT